MTMVDRIKGKLKRWSTMGDSSPFDYTTMDDEGNRKDRKEKTRKNVDIEMEPVRKKSTEQREKDKQDEKSNTEIFDNSYTSKKTVAKGLLDFGLLMANASQLKTLLMLGEDEEFYEVNMTLLCTSMILQFVVGVCLLLLASKKTGSAYLNKLNNLTVILVLMITILNVFVAAIGIKHNRSSRNASSSSSETSSGNNSTR